MIPRGMDKKKKCWAIFCEVSKIRQGKGKNR